MCQMLFLLAFFQKLYKRLLKMILVIFFCRQLLLLDPRLLSYQQVRKFPRNCFMIIYHENAHIRQGKYQMRHTFKHLLVCSSGFGSIPEGRNLWILNKLLKGMQLDCWFCVFTKDHCLLLSDFAFLCMLGSYVLPLRTFFY